MTDRPPIEDSQFEGRMYSYGNMPVRPKLPPKVEQQLEEAVHVGPPRIKFRFKLPQVIEDAIKKVTET